MLSWNSAVDDLTPASGLTYNVRAGTNALVSWSPPTWGWHLEETPALNPAAWSNSPSGELNPTAVSTTHAAQFYRLVNP
jgi:hypothetical protein